VIVFDFLSVSCRVMKLKCLKIELSLWISVTFFILFVIVV